MSTNYRLRKEENKRLKKEIDEQAARLEFLLEKERLYKDGLLKSVDTYYQDLKLEELTSEEKKEVKSILRFLFSYSRNKKEIMGAFKKAQQKEVIKYKSKLNSNNKYYAEVLKRRRHQLNIQFLNYYVDICGEYRDSDWLNTNWFYKCREAFTLYDNYQETFQKYHYHLDMIEQLKGLLLKMLKRGKKQFPDITFYKTLFDEELLTICQSYCIDSSYSFTESSIKAFLEELYIGIEEIEEHLDTVELQWRHCIDENLYVLLDQFYLRKERHENLKEVELSNLKASELINNMKKGVTKRLEENFMALEKCVSHENLSLLTQMVENAQTEYLKSFKSKISTYKVDELVEVKRGETILKELLEHSKNVAKNFNFDDIADNKLQHHRVQKEIDAKVNGVFRDILSCL